MTCQGLQPLHRHRDRGITDVKHWSWSFLSRLLLHPNVLLGILFVNVVQVFFVSWKVSRTLRKQQYEKKIACFQRDFLHACY